jgi:hypothetical protein
MAQTKAQLIAPVGSGLTLEGNLTATDLYVSTDYPTVRPALDFPFALTRELDSRITFGRSTTGTFVDKDGFIKTAAINQPRFDHDPTTGESLGLLIEESRTNSYQQSSNMSNAYWGLTNLTTSANAAVAPDGTTTATLIAANTATSTHALIPNITLSSTATITVSVFLKSNGGQYFTIRGDNQTNYCTFDLINGTVTSASTLNSTTASIVAYPNGWYRCIVTYTPINTACDPEFYIANSSTYGVSTFSGTGTNGFYIWGGQLETGSFPTSYIPTTTASVTRTADIASITGTNLTSWYNQREGTWVIDTYKDRGIAGYYAALFYMRPTNTGIGTRNEIYKGSGNSRFTFQYGINDYTTVANINPADGISAGNNKIFAYYKENDFGLGFNGSIKGTDTAGGVQQQTDPSIYLVLGSTLDSEFWNGHFRRFTYYPVKLNSTQLTNLTS